MAYTDVPACRARLRGIAKIDDATQGSPFHADMVELISQFEGEVDATFASVGITVPITDVNVTKRLKVRITGRACYEFMVSRGVSITEKVKPLWLDWKKDYDDMLAAILAGTLAPASESASADLPWSFTMDPDETDPSDSKNPAWTRDYVE